MISRLALGMTVMLTILWGVDSASAYDRCSVVEGDCTNPSLYEIDFAFSAPANERACESLVPPCTSGSLIPWIQRHFESRQALAGRQTSAAIRGGLLESPQSQIDEEGRFRNLGGKSLRVCFRRDGAPSAVAFRSATCPVLPSPRKCTQGMIAEGNRCLFPAPVGETDPLVIVRTLARANEVIEAARKQISGSGSDVEVNGSMRGVLPGPRVPPVGSGGSQSGAASGAAGTVENSSAPKRPAGGDDGGDTWVAPKVGK